MLQMMVFFFYSMFFQCHADWIENADSIQNASPSGDYLAGGAESRGAQYVIPNEIYPEEAKNIWQQAPKGAYISVGTERGFIGASLTPLATHLILIDLVPEIVFYNRMNVLLLKISSSLADYLSLRQATSIDRWQINVKKMADLTSEERELLNSKIFFEKFKALQIEPTSRLQNPSMFVGSSYLRSEDQYNRLREMALADRIWVGLGNLLDGNFLQEINNRLVSKGITISVLDLSNAWDFHYTGAKGLNQIIAKLESSLRQNSILLATNVRKMISTSMYEWSYHGFRYSALTKIRDILNSESSLHTLVRAKKLFPVSTVVTPEDLNRFFLVEAKILDYFKNQPRTAQFIIWQMKRLNKCIGISCSMEVRSCKNLFAK